MTPLATFVELPAGTLFVRCPDCGEQDGHLGNCSLSMMQTGRHYAVLAVPLSDALALVIPADRGEASDA